MFYPIYQGFYTFLGGFLAGFPNRYQQYDSAWDPLPLRIFQESWPQLGMPKLVLAHPNRKKIVKGFFGQFQQMLQKQLKNIIPELNDTVDGRNPAPVEVGSLSHYL